MKTFIYKVMDGSNARGYNKTVVVYRMKRNVPDLVGYDEHVDTAAFKGYKTVAHQLISDSLGYKMNAKGYALESKDIQLFEV